MGQGKMALTEQRCRTAKATGKPYKLTDARGLILSVSAVGTRTWRYRFTWQKQEQLLTIGQWPEVSLKTARDKRNDARKALDQGIDPRKGAAVRDDQSTLRAVADRWLTLNASRWVLKYEAQVRQLLAGVMDALGDTPIGAVTGRMLLSELQKEDSPWMQHRIRGHLVGTFGLALAEGLVDSNPAEQIRAALPPQKRVEHHPAPGTISEARECLKALEGVAAHPTVRLANRLLALSILRPGQELAGIRWSEVSGSELLIPGSRMKMKQPHTVYLSRQALEVLEAARVISGRSDYVFPSFDSSLRHIGEIDGFYRRSGLGGKMSPHSWRSVFSTVLHEIYPGDHAAIELCLAHSPAKIFGEVSAAYNRGTYGQRRRELMQDWADMLMVDVSPAKELLSLPRKNWKNKF
jgi:integrase